MVGGLNDSGGRVIRDHAQSGSAETGTGRMAIGILILKFCGTVYMSQVNTMMSITYIVDLLG